MEQRTVYKRGSNWLWLIPLLALPIIAWGAWSQYDFNKNAINNQAYVLLSPEPSNTGNSVDNSVTNNPQNSNVPQAGTSQNTTVGVGGGPSSYNIPSVPGTPDTGMGGTAQ